MQNYVLSINMNNHFNIIAINAVSVNNKYLYTNKGKGRFQSNGHAVLIYSGQYYSYK